MASIFWPTLYTGEMRHQYDTMRLTANSHRNYHDSCDLQTDAIVLASLFATLFGVAILPLTNSAHESAFVANAHAL